MPKKKGIIHDAALHLIQIFIASSFQALVCFLIPPGAYLDSNSSNNRLCTLSYHSHTTTLYAMRASWSPSEHHPLQLLIVSMLQQARSATQGPTSS
jgi:hypothetical protein